jgi:hypothetical protein
VVKRTPLTNQLRDEASLWAKDEKARDLMVRAADEIERLTAENVRLKAKKEPPA